MRSPPCGHASSGIIAFMQVAFDPSGEKPKIFLQHRDRSPTVVGEEAEREQLEEQEPEELA